MKTKLIAIALFAVTAVAVAFYPTARSNGAVTAPAMQAPPVAALTNERPKVEVVFALDTTGSMGGLIAAAKEKIWSIASSMASAQPAPEIRMGLVAYRDRGDAYVTQVVDLSTDLDSVYAALMDFRAAGGGDGPESVNQALHDAVHGVSWSQDPNAYKVVFLVGDAPPHMDYANDVKYPDTLKVAKQNGIVVNAIQCGRNGRTTRKWQHIAQLGSGEYFTVEQDGSAVAIATPYDEKLATLSAALDDTRLYYGTAEVKEKKRAKVAATKKLHAASSAASRARRAAFNSSKSGEANLLGEGELVEDVASGRVELADIEPEALPAPMQSMSRAQQETVVKETAERRAKLKGEIQALAKQRADFLREQVDAAGGAKDSLDEQIYRTVREQAAPKGLKLEADSAAY